MNHRVKFPKNVTLVLLRETPNFLSAIVFSRFFLTLVNNHYYLIWLNVRNKQIHALLTDFRHRSIRSSYSQSVFRLDYQPVLQFVVLCHNWWELFCILNIFLITEDPRTRLCFPFSRTCVRYSFRCFTTCEKTRPLSYVEVYSDSFVTSKNASDDIAWNKSLLCGFSFIPLVFVHTGLLTQ